MKKTTSQQRWWKTPEGIATRWEELSARPDLDAAACDRALATVQRRAPLDRRLAELLGCGTARLVWTDLRPWAQEAVTVVEEHAEGIAAPVRIARAVALLERNSSLGASISAGVATALLGPHRVQEGRTLSLGDAPLRVFVLLRIARLISPRLTPRAVRSQDPGRLLAGMVAPGWIVAPEWRTDTAVTLARTMYDSREFGAMPILADALQDAGCDNGEWLARMRDTSWPWCRGARVLDDLLGK